ncbi:MAG TPA: hypothetical protein VMV69_22835 [Pirellulales bacterium]|nr:hypothetical protein [Pirellulales bacterium]
MGATTVSGFLAARTSRKNGRPERSRQGYQHRTAHSVCLRLRNARDGKGDANRPEGILAQIDPAPVDGEDPMAAQKGIQFCFDRLEFPDGNLEEFESHNSQTRS